MLLQAWGRTERTLPRRMSEVASGGRALAAASSGPLARARACSVLGPGMPQWGSSSSLPGAGRLPIWAGIVAWYWFPSLLLVSFGSWAPCKHCLHGSRPSDDMGDCKLDKTWEGKDRKYDPVLLVDNSRLSRVLWLVTSCLAPQCQPLIATTAIQKRTICA